MQERNGCATYLDVQLPPHPELLVYFYNHVEVVKVFYDEALLLVERQENLLHGSVTVENDAMRHDAPNPTKLLTKSKEFL